MVSNQLKRVIYVSEIVFGKGAVVKYPVRCKDKNRRYNIFGL